MPSVICLLVLLLQISGKCDEMKWFRNLQKLQDAGTNNETAVEAITRVDYRDDRLTTVTQAEKH